VVAVDVVTAAGDLVRADAGQHSDLYWAARGAGPGFPGVVTRFHLQTYPAYPHMWHDTWTFSLAEGPELLAWLHDLLPKLDRRVEPVLAATRLPDVPLDPGAAHPGTALLLHTTVMTDSPDEASSLLRVFDDCPVTPLGHVRGATSIADENRVQASQSPENHRYAVDCTWTDAPADVLGPPLLRLWSELDTTHSFSIWYGWAPHRELPDMAFSVEGNVYIATYAIYENEADDERYRSWVHARTADIARQDGAGVYLGDTDFTGRQDRFLTDANFDRLAAVRQRWDPDGRIVSYLSADPARLNVHG
jgi:FAD/FMN-containing dehydrogenase